MNLESETLKAMIEAFDGFALTDAELDQVRPELQVYAAAVEELRSLDLSTGFAARLLRVSE